MNNLKIVFAVILIVAGYGLSAQGVAINNDGTTANSSAMLDVKSTEMGILIPRMTISQRDNITTPATGLMIFQTDGTAGFYYFDGSVWKAVGSAAGTAHVYSVGDFAQGGIVFWVDETGQHGLVCAKGDQDGGSGIRWFAGTLKNTKAKGDGPFAGETNTAIIIAVFSAVGDDDGNYAARMCNELKITEAKTYGDWYLPSLEELDLMFQNKSEINTTAGNNSGSSFADDYYWSYTDYSENNAYSILFSDGSLNSNAKTFTYRVRAIRAF